MIKLDFISISLKKNLSISIPLGSQPQAREQRERPWEFGEGACTRLHVWVSLCSYGHSKAFPSIHSYCQWTAQHPSGVGTDEGEGARKWAVTEHHSFWQDRAQDLSSGCRAVAPKAVCWVQQQSVFRIPILLHSQSIMYFLAGITLIIRVLWGH